MFYCISSIRVITVLYLLSIVKHYNQVFIQFLWKLSQDITFISCLHTVIQPALATVTIYDGISLVNKHERRLHQSVYNNLRWLIDWLVFKNLPDFLEYIKVITKLPNSEQSYKGKVKTHNYINRQNQSTTGKLWKP